MLFVGSDLNGQAKFPMMFALGGGRINKILRNFWNPSPLNRRGIKKTGQLMSSKPSSFHQHLDWKSLLFVLLAGKAIGTVQFLSVSLALQDRWTKLQLNSWQWSPHSPCSHPPVLQQKSCVLAEFLLFLSTGPQLTSFSYVRGVSVFTLCSCNKVWWWYELIWSD